MSGAAGLKRQRRLFQELAVAGNGKKEGDEGGRREGGEGREGTGRHLRSRSWLAVVDGGWGKKRWCVPVWRASGALVYVYASIIGRKGIEAESEARWCVPVEEGDGALVCW